MESPLQETETECPIEHRQKRHLLIAFKERIKNCEQKSFLQLFLDEQHFFAS